VRHREANKAQYAVVVAKDFEGGEDATSALGVECAQHSVVPIRARDLALLVQVAAARAVPLLRLGEMLETCRTTKQCADWVRALLAEEANVPPLHEVLDALVAEQGESKDQVELASLVTRLRMSNQINTSKEELRDWIQALSTMAPSHITIIGDVVTLETTKERVLEMLAKHNSELPDYVRAMYLDKWLGDG
jgi:tRNA G37 N-methylase Trm5